jgi:hypothetical protein
MSSFNPKAFPILDGSGDRVMYVDDLIAVHEFGPALRRLSDRPRWLRALSGGCDEDDHSYGVPSRNR